VRSAILQTVTRFVAPGIVVYALYLLWRGHNAPGGGFIAGLMTAAAVIAWALAFGLEVMRRRWELGLGLGLLLAAGTGLAPMLAGRPFLAHAVLHAGPVAVSSSLLFDVGVYVLVVSAVMAAVRTLALVGEA
jgi:multisubunit Na+/H+ antiporter MnhB subunit